MVITTTGEVVSDRVYALDVIWDRIVDRFVAGDIAGARVEEIVYTLVENMSDYDFEKGYRNE